MKTILTKAEIEELVRKCEGNSSACHPDLLYFDAPALLSTCKDQAETIERQQTILTAFLNGIDEWDSKDHDFQVIFGPIIRAALSEVKVQ